jgi:FkbM family methyltransferase
MMREEIDALLATSVGDVRKWERAEFDRLSGGRPLVLMGSGGLGRRALSGLRRNGIEALAFADNNPARQGTEHEGIRILSPQDAAREFRHRAAFVVTIWGANSPHRFEHSRRQLTALGCDCVLPFPPLFWKYADGLLPFYLQDLPSHVFEQRMDVLRAFDVWEDDESRAQYVAQVRFRTAADFDGLSHPVTYPQYFPPDLFAWSDSEWIVDGGAYDGDSIQTLTALHGDRFTHVLALEPDPDNFARLVATVDALPPRLRAKIDCRMVAVAADACTLHINRTGTASSATSAAASSTTVAVQANTIDALTAGARSTFLKLDIEGFEIEALHGAKRTIDRDAPIIAVCVYHRQDHLWRIPLLLREWRGDYALFLRPHNEEGWDLVCYAVPRARLSGLRQR